MKTSNLLALLIKHRTNLKTLKQRLNPNIWALFAKHVNNNDIKKANILLTEFL